MSQILKTAFDRVRKVTSASTNEEIDKEIDENISFFSNQPGNLIERRIRELDKEWDIERTLELNASLIGLTGIFLAATINKKWLILPGIVTAFLAQHAIQGWCPPVSFFRKLHFRTRKEIDREKYSLLEALHRRKYNADYFNYGAPA